MARRSRPFGGLCCDYSDVIFVKRQIWVQVFWTFLVFLGVQVFHLVGSPSGSLYIITMTSSPHSSSNCSFTFKHLCTLNMVLIVIVTAVLFLMIMPEHEATRILKQEQVLMNTNQFFKSKMQVPLPASSTTGQKAFADHNVSPLLPRLLRAYVPPSAPNPVTEMPPKSTIATSNASSLLGSQQKSPPAPSMLKEGTSIP